MLAIGHFAVGVSGALLVLLYHPRWIPHFLKNDIFVVLLSGLWAMLPDITMVFSETNSAFLHEWWGNIFWAHPYIDSFTKDNPATAAVFMGVAGILTYAYFRKVGEL